MYCFTPKANCAEALHHNGAVERCLACEAVVSKASRYERPQIVSALWPH